MDTTEAVEIDLGWFEELTERETEALDRRHARSLTYREEGYNLERIRSFLAKKAEEKAEAEKPRCRAQRKSGTWADIASKRLSSVGRDPPHG